MSVVQIHAASTFGPWPSSDNLARMSTGRLVQFSVATGTATFRYSDDEGASWGTLTGTVATSSSNPHNFQIMDNDLFVYSYSNGSSIAAVVVGTISGTTITWGTPFLWGGLVAGWFTAGARAWREGTDTFVATFIMDTNANRSYLYVGRRPDAGGWSIAYTSGLIQLNASQVASVDFRHTGDGRRVQTQPDIFITWQANAVANHYFVKFTWGAGPTWTMGTIRSLATSPAAPGSTEDQYGSGMYDGTHFIMTYRRTNTPFVGVVIRDLADTTTTNNEPAATGTSANNNLTISLHPSGDYALALVSGTDQDLYTNHWRKTLGTWSGWTNRHTATSSGTSLERIATGAKVHGVTRATPPTGTYYFTGETWPPLQRFERFGMVHI